jgi:hypothetical protein
MVAKRSAFCVISMMALCHGSPASAQKQTGDPELCGAWEGRFEGNIDDKRFASDGKETIRLYIAFDTVDITIRSRSKIYEVLESDKIDCEKNFVSGVVYSSDGGRAKFIFTKAKRYRIRLYDIRKEKGSRHLLHHPSETFEIGLDKMVTQREGSEPTSVD